MAYEYELFVNGVRRAGGVASFRTNVIAEIVEWLPMISTSIDEITIKVKRTSKGQ